MAQWWPGQWRGTVLAWISIPYLSVAYCVLSLRSACPPHYLVCSCHRAWIIAPILQMSKPRPCKGRCTRSPGIQTQGVVSGGLTPSTALFPVPHAALTPQLYLLPADGHLLFRPRLHASHLNTRSAALSPYLPLVLLHWPSLLTTWYLPF